MSDLGNREVMAKNIRRLMDRAGITRVQICDDLGIKYTTFADWINGKTYPRIDKIELMAKYFGVSKSELVEETSYISYFNDLHYRGIINRSEGKLFSEKEQIAIKEHFDDLLARYKALVEATENCKLALMNQFREAALLNHDVSPSPIDHEMIKRYLEEDLESEIDSLCAWIKTAPFYFSYAMEGSFRHVSATVQKLPQVSTEENDIADTTPPPPASKAIQEPTEND